MYHARVVYKIYLPFYQIYSSVTKFILFLINLLSKMLLH
jgi:hypothetical protein